MRGWVKYLPRATARAVRRKSSASHSSRPSPASSQIPAPEHIVQLHGVEEHQMVAQDGVFFDGDAGRGSSRRRRGSGIGDRGGGGVLRRGGGLQDREEGERRRRA
jgi:hypothetical protein